MRGERRNRGQGAIIGESRRRQGAAGEEGGKVVRREAVCQENSDTPPEFQTFHLLRILFRISSVQIFFLLLLSLSKATLSGIWNNLSRNAEIVQHTFQHK